MMVRNLDCVTAYYRDMLGLTVQGHTRQVAVLGVGGVALLELVHRPDALPDDPREAGLYHTAFLMPTRADLARWILHAAKARVPFIGASDHDVSEAIYLDDPEGNGVEVYSDRPREKWRRDGKLIFQKTDPLDIDAIIREIDPATATYPSAPEGLRVGHIHLRVGNVARAEAFYCIGWDIHCAYLMSAFGGKAHMMLALRMSVFDPQRTSALLARLDPPGTISSLERSADDLSRFR
jgi:catechol 2,3-dioxygenase